MIERAKQILIILELTEWRWTILDVLAQPEQELAAVMHLKNIGEKIRIQNRNSGNESAEKV